MLLAAQFQLLKFNIGMLIRMWKSNIILPTPRNVETDYFYWQSKITLFMIDTLRYRNNDSSLTNFQNLFCNIKLNPHTEETWNIAHIKKIRFHIIYDKIKSCWHQLSFVPVFISFPFIWMDTLKWSLSYWKFRATFKAQ